MIYAGCDLGSTTGKVVLIDDNAKVLGWHVVRSLNGPEKTAERAIAGALAQAGLSDSSHVTRWVSTGYGRGSVAGMQEEISEISCHARGATHLHPATRLIIDIGGQDCKVIAVNNKGQVVDFQMNDKCSAGTGRFFEVMARVLDLDLTQLAEEALRATKVRPISKQCSVFAESEVITLINNNVPVPEIAAGIHDAIARRIHGMAFKVGVEEDVVLTGGCAQNQALRRALEKRMKIPLADLGENPQIVGALGAALFAREHAS